MARDALRRLLEARLGAPGRALLAWRTRRRAEALLIARGLARPATAVARALEDTVARGPFAGMHYPRRLGDIVHTAKLVGAYECELHDAVETLLARRPSLVVNIGAGDGYYAVGLARRRAADGESVRVLAVDPDPIAQRACRDTARRNGVAAQLVHLARLDAAGLEPHLRDATGRALVVVDAEGFEEECLDLAQAPSLAHADLLIETHDFARPGVHARLTARLGVTHDVREIAIAARTAAAYPELAAIDPTVARGLLDEFRHVPQAWLVLTARR